MYWSIWHTKLQFLTKIFLFLSIGLSMSSCMENKSSTEITVQLIPTPDSTSTPTLRPEFTITPTPVMATPMSLPVFPTATPTETYKGIDLEFRITYVIYEQDENNEIVNSQLFVLEKPYETPQLIYSSKVAKNDQNIVIFSQFPWSHNKQKMIFSYQTNSGSQSAFIYDLSTGVTSPLLTSIQEGYQIILNKFNWSLDDRWFYIPVYEGFAIRSQVIDIASGEVIALDYFTQDELLAWSFVNSDQFISITRPNFPEPNGENISIHKIGSPEPLTSISDFQGYILLSDDFSLAPNEEQAVIKAISQNGTPVHLLLNFITGQWKVILQNQDIPVTKYWSPDDKWLVFNRFNDGLFLLEIENPSQLIQISSSNSATPLAWLSDNTMLVFQDGLRVYGVFPEKPDSIFLIQDFSSILQDIAPLFQIDLITSKR